MLYDMDKVRCHEKIIKPVLKEYLSPELSKENFLNYYNKAIVTLYICNFGSSALANPMLTLICSAFNITTSFDIIPNDVIDDSYITDYVIYIGDEMEDPEHEGGTFRSCSPASRNETLERIEQLSGEEKEKFLESIIDIDATDEPIYEIPIQEIIDNPSAFTKLIDELYDDDVRNQFRIHYKQIYDLLYKK